MKTFNIIYNDDCMNIFPNMPDNNVDLTLTDIPYDNVNRNSGGLRNLDKSKADILTFDLFKFLDEIYRVTKKNDNYILWERTIFTNF